MCTDPLPESAARQRGPTTRGPTELPQRRTPAKGVHLTLSGPNWVFLTVCAKERVAAQQRGPTNAGVSPVGTRCHASAGSSGWLAQPSVQRALHDLWRDTATAWLVSDYLLMPEHLHLFCTPQDWQFSIERWIAFWKDQLAKTCPDAGAFQRGGFHHRLRHEESYARKWQYVRENPVRAGLVKQPEDWPYQGRVHEITWA